MSLPLPLTFHVETRRCVNPACNRRVTSESTFCASCWNQLGHETKRKISTAHITRNRRCVDRYVKRGIRELKRLTQERQNNAVSIPTSDRSMPAPATGPADRPRHNRLGERGVGA